MNHRVKPSAFALRLPPELRAWVEGRAHRLDRSMNWIVTQLVAQAKQQQEQREQMQ